LLSTVKGRSQENKEGANSDAAEETMAKAKAENTSAVSPVTVTSEIK